MEYICRLESNGSGGVLATFPDVPEAITEGDTRAEALEHAADALEVSLLGRIKDGEEIPVSKARPRGGVAVVISAQASAKLAFYTAFRKSRLTRSALARKLGKDEAEIRRMLDPYHATKLSALEGALLALGQRLIVTVQAA